MSGTRFLTTAGVLAAILALSSPVPARARASQDPPRAGARGQDDAAEARREERVAAIQRSIERAFVRCDVSPLKEFLARRVKIFVSAGALGISDGYYGADQLLLLVQRMFDRRSTVRFTLLPVGSRARAGGQARVPALWLYREEGSLESEVRISFTLAPEGGHWSIREIRELK
jgi:hypothetical protein